MTQIRQLRLYKGADPSGIATGLTRLNVTVENKYGLLHHSALIFEVIHSCA